MKGGKIRILGKINIIKTTKKYSEEDLFLVFKKKVNIIGECSSKIFDNDLPNIPDRKILNYARLNSMIYSPELIKEICPNDVSNVSVYDILYLITNVFTNKKILVDNGKPNFFYINGCNNELICIQLSRKDDGWIAFFEPASSYTVFIKGTRIIF